MSDLTVDQLITICMKATLETAGGPEQVRDTINWVTKELTERKIPMFVALTAFAAIAEGARTMIEKMRGAADVVQ